MNEPNHDILNVRIKWKHFDDVYGDGEDDDETGDESLQVRKVAPVLPAAPSLPVALAKRDRRAMSDRFDYLEFGPIPEPVQPQALQFEPEVEEIAPVEGTLVELPVVEELPDPEPLTWHVAPEPDLQPLRTEPAWTPDAPNIDPPVLPGHHPEPWQPATQPEWTQVAPLAPGGAQRRKAQEYAPAQRTHAQGRTGRHAGAQLDLGVDRPIQSINAAVMSLGGLVSGLLGALTFDWLFGAPAQQSDYAMVDYATYTIASRHGAEVHYHLVNVCKIKVASETYTDNAEWMFSVPVYHHKRTERALDALGIEWRKVEK